MAARRPLARLAALAFPLLADGQAHAGSPPSWLNPEKQANIANCVVNVGLASTFLGKAGVSINAAVLNCDESNHPGGDTTAVCAAAISGVVASFGYAAGFISAAAAECRSSLELVDKASVLREGCATNTAFIVASLSLMANAGATIRDTCAGIPPNLDLQIAGPGAMNARRLGRDPAKAPLESRRLAEQGSNRTLVYDRLKAAMHTMRAAGLRLPSKRGLKGGKGGHRLPAQNAACAFDVGQFTLFAARAGLMINGAVKDCSAQTLFVGGNLNQAKCVNDLGQTIGAFGFMASGIAFTVFDCPDIISNLDAACAGAIINLVAATAEVVGSGAAQANTCAQLGKVTNGRRLSTEPNASEHLQVV